jgi:hypothetical protein
MREAEIKEARREAAELRKQQEARAKKRVCIPHASRETMAPIMACAASPEYSIIVMPDTSPTVRFLIWELLGVGDITECVKDPTLIQCTIAAVGVLPVGKIKIAGKFVEKISDGVDGVLESRKGIRAVGCFTGGAPHSFPAGTPVLMADGTRRAIEQVRVGEFVTATNPETGETEARPVTQTIATPDDRDFTTVALADGSEITSTDHHPFWSENRKRWIDAVDLRMGDALRTPVGTAIQVGAVSHWKGLQPAFDLTVANLHTYYVSSSSADILVHNTDAACPPWVQKIFGWLTPYNRLGDKTHGALRDPSTGNPFPGVDGKYDNILSGQTGDELYHMANDYLRTSNSPIYGGKSPKATFVISSHVETKYAALMKSKKIKHGAVVINNSNGVCKKQMNCENAIEAILAPGEWIDVYSPNSSKPKRVYGKWGKGS